MKTVTMMLVIRRSHSVINVLLICDVFLLLSFVVLISKTFLLFDIDHYSI